MTTSDVTDQLKAFRYNVAGWMTTAAALRERAEQVLASREIDFDELVAVESGLSRLRAEITEFDNLAMEVFALSTDAGGLLAETREALRLVLLEITEISSAMYSVKSFPVEEL